jgi:tRNA-dihydrouridine synthase 1
MAHDISTVAQASESSTTVQIQQTNGAQKKLHGRAFYESLGSPKFILAPMVDQSEFVSSLWTSVSKKHLTTETGMANIDPIFHDYQCQD